MKIRAALTGLLLSSFLLLFLHTAWDKSPTWDEVGYLGLGTYLLKTGRWDVPAAGSHPPLAYYLHGLPAFFYSIDWSPWNYDPSFARDIGFLRSADVKRGNALLLDSSYDGEQLLFASRTTSLVFAVLLAILLCGWARQLYGPSRSWLPLLLFALSPNLLAHAPLITTDFPLTATFFLAVFTFRRLLLSPGLANLGLAGLGLGLALLSKLSALILFPGLGLVLIWFLLWGSVTQKQALTTLFSLSWLQTPVRSCAALYLSVSLLSLFTLWTGYGFQVEPYWLALRSQLWDISSGHAAYLMGDFSSTGWWYFFPLAFLIKTPLPTLLLVAFGCWSLCRQMHSDARLELGFLLLPPLLLAALFVASGSKNIGLRYLLPVYPFLFLVAGAALRSASSVHLSSRSAYRSLLLAALCLWYAVGTARIHPHHLAYFNELIGGPQNGYRYLVDSNLDWGQDLKGLKRFMDARGIERIKLSYFGTVDPALYGLEYEWLPSFLLPRRSAPPIVLPTSGYIAVSVTNLAGVYMDAYGHGRHLFRWLEEYEPIARIGHSILVYDVPPPE